MEYAQFNLGNLGTFLEQTGIFRVIWLELKCSKIRLIFRNRLYEAIFYLLEIDQQRKDGRRHEA